MILDLSSLGGTKPKIMPAVQQPLKIKLADDLGVVVAEGYQYKITTGARVQQHETQIGDGDAR